MQSAFPEPIIILYPVFQQIPFQSLYIQRKGVCNKGFSSFFGRRFNVFIPVNIRKILCMVDNVLTVISVFGKFIALFIHLHIAYFKRCCKLLNLISCVVYIEFSFHLIACIIKHTCKSVAQCTATSISNVHRSCGVCRYKFNQHFLSLTVIGTPIVFSLSFYFLNDSRIK